MRLTARQFLTCLVILFMIGGLYARQFEQHLTHKPVKCETDRDCKGKNAKCIRRECLCTGYNDYGTGKWCRQWDTCEQNLCHTNGRANFYTHCLVKPADKYHLVCKCDPGYFGRAKDPYCISTEKVDGKYPCLKDANCAKYSRCVMLPGVQHGYCACPSDLTGDGEECQPIIECKNNTDCQRTDSTCINERCTCNDELKLGQKSCEPAPLHACADSSDCHTLAKCLKGNCICQGKTTGNGFFCRESLECSLYCGRNGTCVKERLIANAATVCKCDEGFAPRGTGGKCVECLENAECRYGTCNDDECQCKRGQVKDGKTCKRAPIHRCEKDEDCHEKAECFLGKCYCKGKLSGNGYHCRDSQPCSKEFEEKCEAGGSRVLSCVVDPLFPDQPECKCHHGFKTSEDGICVEMTVCDKKDIVCPTRKVCKSGTGDHYWCACTDGYDEIQVGAEQSTCKDIDECSEKPCPANSDCENIEGSYKCECRKGFRKSADQKKCEVGANQICPEGICRCLSGFVMNSDGECEDVDECIRDASLCGASEECINDHGTYSCVCRLGYKRKNTACVKIEKCQSLSECRQDEDCVKGKCKCKQGYRKSILKGFCVPRRRYSDEDSLGLSLHGNGFLSTFLFGVLGRLAFTE